MYIFFVFFQKVRICNICLPLLSFTSIHSVQSGPVAHPASRSMNTGLSFPGVKRPGSAVNHLPLSSDKVKNKWSHTSTPLHADIRTYIRTQLHSNSWYSVSCDRQLSLCVSVPPQAKGPETLRTTRMTYLQVTSLESDKHKEQNYFKRESELFNIVVWSYYR
jgi:hypothetical protein